MNSKPDLSTCPGQFSVALIFIFVLMAFGVVTIIDIFDGPDTARQESVAETPKLDFNPASIKRLPGDFRYYVKNRFGFKEALVTLNSRIKGTLFGVSPYSKVVIGKSNFLFLGTPKTIEFTQGIDLFDDEELTSWQLTVQTNSRQIEQMGGRYHMVLTPNKHTIYSDMLPDWVNVGRVGETRADQLLKRSLSEGLPVHDFRQVLIQQRKSFSEVPLYYKTDTHWNEFGASVAVSHLLSKLGLDNIEPLQPIPIEAGQGGDLSRMIGLEGRVTETPWSFTSSSSFVCRDGAGAGFIRNQTDPFRFDRLECVNSAAPDLSAVVFVDSFGVAMIPSIASAFRHVTFLWQYEIDYSIIGEVKPDFVIHQITERKLQTPGPEFTVIYLQIKRLFYILIIVTIAFVFWSYFQVTESIGEVECRIRQPTSATTDIREIVLIGNSLLYDFDWSIGGATIINCARQGLTLEKFLASHPNNKKFDPEFVVIAFGTVEAIRQKNIRNYARKAFLQDLAQLNRWLASSWPQSRIVVTAVPPINNQFPAGEGVEPALVDQINHDLASLFRKPGSEWIELRSFLDVDDHGLTEEMTYDGVHLSILAYKRWNAELENIVGSYQ